MNEIINFLKENKNEKDKKTWINTVKHNNVYGVRLSKINPMITKWYKKINFEDIEKLWEDGKTESKIIAAKLLGKIGKKDKEKTIKVIKKFIKNLEDWATTDTLATQGIRGIIKDKKEEIKKIAIDSLNSKNIFTKRFGIVVFINFPEEKETKTIIKKFENKKEHYLIKKAIEWLKRKLNKQN